MTAAGTSAPEDALRAVLDATADGMVVVDEFGIICYANPAAHELFGRDGDDLPGRFFGFPLQEGEPTEIGVFRDGQPLTLEMRVAELSWDGQAVRLATLHDVTARKEAEEALRAALSLRDDVVTIIGHDLRTPLATILAAARLLIRDAADADALEPQHRDLLERIRRQAWHLSRLVDSLLTLSRLEGDRLHVELRPVEVRPALERVLTDLFETDADLDVRVEVPRGLRVNADESHLRQMLANYLGNAASHGGPPVEVRAGVHGDQVEIVVADHGDGVPDELVPHLFDRLSRKQLPSGVVRGTGLGLTVVRRLAEAGDGQAWYEPNQPRGACFGVRLPTVPEGVDQ